MRPQSNSITILRPKVVISNTKPFVRCCEKWSMAMAVPMYSWGDNPMSAVQERDMVNFCPVCGQRVRDPYKVAQKEPR